MNNVLVVVQNILRSPLDFLSELFGMILEAVKSVFCKKGLSVGGQ